MSTTNKILQTIGVAAVCDFIGAVGVGLAHACTAKYSAKVFAEDFLGNVAFSTLPALGVFGIEKFVNQNITSNKTIQYGLTVAESVLVILKINSIELAPQYGNNLTKLFSSSFKCQAGMFKIIAANTMIQSLAFKYIWDSSDEKTHELDQTDDLDLNLDALKVSTDFVSL